MGKKHKKHHKHEKSEKRSSKNKTDSDTEYEEEQEKDEEKPLKLVLKVGATTSSQDSDQVYPSAEPSYHERKHKHKKKKRKKDRSEKEKEKHRHHEVKRAKRKYEEDGDEDEEDDDDDENDEDYKGEIDAIEEDEDLVVRKDDIGDKKLREPRSCTMKTNSDGALPVCLDYIHNLCQKKDVNGFFAFPVNDVIAPGYSSIISEPMDFSTMKIKIDDSDYSNVMEYKRDFKLMCENAMTYNRPETIYYKAAKKLLQSGLKILSKDKLVQMRRNLSFLACISDQELGLDAPDPAPDIELQQMKAADKERKKMKAKMNQSLSKYEAVPDNLTANEILEQAQAASKHASDMLTLRKPKTSFGFLRRQKDGTTTMKLLNHENDGILNEKERVVNMGSLVGKLTAGSGSLPGFKEEKRNQVKPVNYLNYGPFSSYAPIYDSSFASLSKEESDILLSCYGTETCVNYATSLQEFVEDCGDYTVKMVDRMLDILTRGEHSKAKAKVDELEKEIAAKQKVDESLKQAAPTTSKSEANSDSKVDFNNLRTLSNIGIDTSFLDTFEKEMRQENKTEVVQKKLDETSGFIKDLERVQNERLSRQPPPHLSYIPGPSPTEIQLAEKVTKGLTDLTKQVKPGDVVSATGVRKALGITVDQTSDVPSSSDDEDDDDDDEEDKEKRTPQSLTPEDEEVASPDVEMEEDRNVDEFSDEALNLQSSQSPPTTGDEKESGTADELNENDDDVESMEI
ncbi:bromodomain-containing protein 7-like [Tubulanus polymorphus]|uniref:bromodomain-containing protein 7-like n=1 Tax=Tubulanus polymorphus TaxID=672921 RepID=UPI003DA641A1